MIVQNRVGIGLRCYEGEGGGGNKFPTVSRNFQKFPTVFRFSEIILNFCGNMGDLGGGCCWGGKNAWVSLSEKSKGEKNTKENLCRWT